MNEYALIERMHRVFAAAGTPTAPPFLADAELLHIGDAIWAITTDEFSAEEDSFTCVDPAALGRNLAVATLSDLLAVGALPRYFLQALVVPRRGGEAFALELCRGLATVLREADCSLLGGDLGVSRNWRFTGTALGEVSRREPLTRSFGDQDGELWVSGSLGDANAAALLGTSTPPFELRLATAAVAARAARGCIDTSGGLLDALHQLGRANPGSRIVVELAALPIAASAYDAAQAAVLPPLAALVGGAGEYELVFGIPATADPTVRAELLALGALPCGRIHHDGPAGLFVDAGGETRSAPPCPDARGFRRRRDYLAAVVRAALALGGVAP